MKCALIVSAIALAWAAPPPAPALSESFLNGDPICQADGIQFKLNADNSYIHKYFQCDSSLNNFCHKLAAGGIVVPMSKWDGTYKIPQAPLKVGCAKVVFTELTVTINYDACDIDVVRGYPSSFNYVYEKFVFLPNAYLLGVVPIDAKAWTNYTFAVECQYPVDAKVDATLDKASGSGADPTGAMVEFHFLDGLKQPINGPVALGSEVIYDIRLSQMFQYNSIIPQSCVFSTSATAGDSKASEIPFVEGACPVAPAKLNNQIISSEYVGDKTAAKQYQVAFKLFQMTRDSTALYVHCNVAICVTENADCVPNGDKGDACPKDALWTQQPGTQPKPSKTSFLRTYTGKQATETHVQVVSQKIEIAV